MAEATLYDFSDSIGAPCFPQSPTAPNRPDVSEDEQLQRAVAESMGMAGAGYGKTWLRDFAELPPALKLGAHSRRRQGA